MTERLYDLHARINANGSLALEARDLITLPNGRVIEGDPRPIEADDAAAIAFVGTFNATAVASIAELQEQLATMTANRDTLAREATERAARIEELTADHAAYVEAKMAETEAVALAHAETVSALRAEIELLRNPPANPRILARRAFGFGLLGTEVLLAAWASEDPMVGVAALNLLLAEFVDLDDPETEQLLGILAAAGLLTEQRMQEILATGKGA